MWRLRSWISLFFLFLLAGTVPAAGQSVASIVDDMRARFEQQFETVDTYIVETNLHTSYHEKVIQDGVPTYRTHTRPKGEGAGSFAATTTPSTAYGLQFGQLKAHAAYAGLEVIDGLRCHVLRVDDPSAVAPEIGTEAERLTYYIDADRHVPLRMVLRTRAPGPDGLQASTVTVNMQDYRTIKGLMLPFRMEVQIDVQMSKQQRRQMQAAMAQLEQMPPQQRKQMERMMGDKMKQMTQLMGGEPVLIEVQSVQVNTPIPEGLF